MPVINTKLNQTTPYSLLILCIGMIACGLLSVAFGKELQWDLVSYHYYNAFALLHHRWGYDDWPSSYTQIFYSPFMDLFPYFLINHLKPVLTVFILGAIHGINFWLIYCISYMVLTDYPRNPKILMSILLAMVGMFGPISLSELGSLMGDNFISLFGLAGVLLQLMALQSDMQASRRYFLLIFLSGLLVGMGVGLKLTLIYAAVGMAIANLFISIPLKQKSQLFFIWGIGAAIGFLTSYGYWLGFLWIHYHNPFFPMYNGIFKAPGFSSYNFYDDRFFPRNFLQTVFYPFYFSKNGALTCDLTSRDFRLVAIYILLVLSGMMWIGRKLMGNHQKNINILHQWLIIFFVAAYITWQLLLSNLRYLVALQMLSPVMIYLLLDYLISNALIRRSVLSVILYYIVATMVPMAQERMPIVANNDYFNVKLPEFVTTQKTAMVLTVAPNFSYLPEGLLSTGIPFMGDANRSYTSILQTYLIPFFPKNWQFVGVSALNHEYLISRKAITSIQDYSGPLYLLTAAHNMPSFIKLANQLGFNQRGPCGAILSDRLALSRRTIPVLLCQVTKNQT